MTSPSSSIVVVDKSGSVDASNLIQSSQHVHQAQHQPIRAQQVILNEEYLSGENIVRAGNVNYLIPMPTSAAPMIKPTTISQHPNSKVHVISNVTLVSKAGDQSQSQTINFVNSKHIQPSNASIGGRASVTGGNYVNISAKSQLQNKMFKSPTMTQMDPHQTTHIVSAQQQQQSTQHQQQHIITKHLNNASAIVQKVIPRNILVSGRIQNKIEVNKHTRFLTTEFLRCFFFPRLIHELHLYFSRDFLSCSSSNSSPQPLRERPHQWLTIIQIKWQMLFKFRNRIRWPSTKRAV